MNLAILLFLISTFIIAIYTIYSKEEKDNWTGVLLYQFFAEYSSLKERSE